MQKNSEWPPDDAMSDRIKETGSSENTTEDDPVRPENDPKPISNDNWV